MLYGPFQSFCNHEISVNLNLPIILVPVGKQKKKKKKIVRSVGFLLEFESFQYA